ncbi:zinc finger protein 260-like [Tenebrio molitor]|uniref:zinc finger protein 260-like n=1 Tax=Tenebrio molitor TaxID=7067 RepID=UPI0036247B7E
MADCEPEKLENIFEDIDRRCRTCLQMCVELNALSKYIEIGDVSLSLTELILSCASVQISDTDEFPQRICETCKDAAVKSHLFRVQCESSDKYLQTTYSKRESSTPSKPCTRKVVTDVRPEESVKDSVDEKSHIRPTSCGSLKTTDPTEEIPKLDSENDEEETIQIKIEGNDEKHSCHSCSESFSTKKNLIKHLKIQKFKCSTCEFTFHTVDEYRSHKKQHGADTDCDNVKKRTCGYCDKVFQYRTSMLKHQRKHNAPPRTCSYCSFKPTSPSVLSKHMEQVHSHLKTFTCSLCDKAFFKKANLRLHVQVHSGVKKHTCEICGMSFVLRGNLSVHRRLHTGERPYTCSSCGRGFTQQSALRSHEAGHSDRRDHVCPECGAAFSRAGALRNHRKRHSSARPFECSVCGKKFTFSSERKRHMMIHTGDKNHECEVCGRRFTRSTNLKVHKRIHTGETPHVCNVCGKGFIQAHCLRTHMNTHAADVATPLVQ